jgi:RNA 3'-terminal phosphate cyclase (ATP)
VQVVSVPLGLTGGISVLKLRGGTHLSGGVPFHYLSLIWQPMMRELGFDLELELSAAGWSEEGGGEATLTLRPVLDVDPFERRGRGMLREARILSLVSNLPFSTACRQSERALQRLKEKGVLAEAENIPVPAPRSCGSMCMITGFFERGRAGFASLGGAQAIAEGVADEAASDFVQFIEGRSAIDPCLAEQLLVPAAVAAAGLRGASRPITRFTTPCVTDALVATASAIGRFLEDVEVAILASADGEAEVRVAPRGESLMAALQGRAGHVKPSS